jgi:hypothetical protein
VVLERRDRVSAARVASDSAAASPNTTLAWPSEKKKPMPIGRRPCASIFRVVLSIAAM